MMRFVKLVLPYVLGAVGAVVAFGAGAYTSFHFAGMFLNPQLGRRDIARLAEDHIILQYLDSGSVDQARAFLVSMENGRVLAINAVSPYLSDQEALSACRLLRAVGNFRIAHPTGAGSGASPGSANVDNMVSETLRNPVACRPVHAGH
jgi:hypothetical protein